MALGAGVGAVIGGLLAVLAVAGYLSTMTEHTAPFFGGVVAGAGMLTVGGAVLGGFVAASVCYPLLGVFVASVVWVLVFDAVAATRIGTVRSAPGVVESAKLDALWVMPVVVLVNAIAIAVFRRRGRRAPAGIAAAALVLVGTWVALVMVVVMVPGSSRIGASDADIFTWERMIPAGTALTCAWLIAAAFSARTGGRRQGPTASATAASPAGARSPRR